MLWNRSTASASNNLFQEDEEENRETWTCYKVLRWVLFLEHRNVVRLLPWKVSVWSLQNVLSNSPHSNNKTSILQQKSVQSEKDVKK